MLDCMSGGRLVAGFPVGTSMDTNFCYGMTPATLRDKYHEAHDLILKAWTEPDVFDFNGKYTQLRYVNIWPRPLQKPHPPIWIPGGGSIETWEWTTKMDYVYAYLSYSGWMRGKQVMDGYWRAIEQLGGDDNPYHAGFLQLVCVSNRRSRRRKTTPSTSSTFMTSASTSGAASQMRPATARSARSRPDLAPRSARPRRRHARA
jgi:alkanesulfonate monooxygenase SsuD/methylene tetrahydromethanopterin reductase-like flavin-dependent oxidoreductase (luciferase family)